MRIAKSPLARRIVAFAAAVVIVHVAFYAGPRWWYSRPRFYPEAHEKAVGALEGVVGPAAVERGVFTIPRQPVVAPYRGCATAFGTGGIHFLYIGAPRDDSFVIDVVDEGYGLYTIAAARLSWEKARSAWGTLQYLCRVEPAFNGMVTGWRHLAYDMGAFSYETWFTTRVTTGFDEPWLRGEPGAAATSFVRASARQLACGAIMREMREYNTSQIDNKALLRAVADIIHKSLGATSWDTFGNTSLGCLVEPYADMAGRDALPLLREIDSWRTREANARRLAQWFNWAPFLKSYLEDRAQWFSDRQPPDVADETRMVTALGGKSTDEQLAELVKIATSPSATGWKYPFNAQRLLVNRWPEAWKTYLADNYASLSPDVRRMVPELESSDRLARLVADDAENLAQAYMTGILCKDDPKELITRLEKIATAQLDRAAALKSNNGRTINDLRRITRTLFDGCKEEPAASEARELVLRLIKHATPEAWADWTADEMVVGATESDSASATAALADILNSPDRAFALECMALRAVQLRAKAVVALGRRDQQAARGALLAYLRGSHPREEEKVTSAVVDAVGDSGDDRALPILEEMLARCPTAGSDTDETVAGPSGVSARALRRAIIAIRVANAADRVGSFASLDAKDQRLIRAESLAWRFNTNELRALLADDRCREARAAIYNALVTNLLKENAKRNARH